MIINNFNIDPIIFSIKGINVYWYGLMYFISFILVLYFGGKKTEKENMMSKDDFQTLLLYGIVGLLAGGRIGYFIFYDPMKITEIANVSDGGMSFHGGLIGSILGIFLFAKKNKISFLKITDLIVVLAPIGLGLGRIGNFINGELWGRISQFNFGMIFEKARNVDLIVVNNDPLFKALFEKYNGIPRYPTTLLEFLLEGVVLFGILWLYTKRTRSTGKATGLFLICYAVFRIVVEFFREPDVQVGLFFELFSMGQLLSLPMLILGLYLFYFRREKKDEQ